MKKTTYTASYTTPDGQTITGTRTSHHPYTHASVRTTYDGLFFTFHSSAALAARKSDGFESVAVVSLTDGTTTEKTTAEATSAKSDKCQGRPASGQGARLQKKCDSCNHIGSARAWRAHTVKP